MDCFDIDEALNKLKRKLRYPYKLKKLIELYPFILKLEFYNVQFNDANIPILNGFVDDGDIYVYCAGCGKWHLHGFPDEGQYREHRRAHCENEDIYRETGYIIQNYAEYLRRTS